MFDNTTLEKLEKIAAHLAARGIAVRWHTDRTSFFVDCDLAVRLPDGAPMVVACRDRVHTCAQIFARWGLSPEPAADAADEAAKPAGAARLSGGNKPNSPVNDDADAAQSSEPEPPAEPGAQSEAWAQPAASAQSEIDAPSSKARAAEPAKITGDAWLAKLTEIPDLPVLIVDCEIFVAAELLVGQYLVLPAGFVLSGNEGEEDLQRIRVNRGVAEALSGHPAQQNRNVKVWCRNDREGFQTAAVIARGIEFFQLHRMGAKSIFNSVHIVIPQYEWPQSGDVNSLISRGWTAEQLLSELRRKDLVDELERSAYRRYGAGWHERSLPGSQRDFEGEACHLSEQHFLLIKDSGISPEVARQRKYRTITTKAELERKGFGASQRSVPTLLIPLYRADGSFADTFQHRPDKPRTSKKTGKPIKYETPVNSHMVLDVHPALSRKRVVENDAPYFDTSERPSLIADPSIPLFITEGVRKGDAAVSIGLCCAALLGIWNWRGANDAGGLTSLADWEYIALNERTAYIAFDSDVMAKRPVYQALKRLKSFLESRRATLKIVYLPGGAHGKKVGLDDFIAAKKLLGESDEQIRAALLELATDDLLPPPDSDEEGVRLRVGQYAETEDGLIRITSNQYGEVRVPLTNFGARIITDIQRDDGVEIASVFQIEVTLNEKTRSFTVPAAQFAAMRWVLDQLGSGAIIYAGQGTTDHARCAIQVLSSETGTARRVEYTHTGWRKIDGQWLYLHAGGAVGADGPVDGIVVTLPQELEPLRLTVADDPRQAIRASLKLLYLGPARLMVPVYGSIWRAVLGDPDFSVYLFGKTGRFKTEGAALVQQHVGAGFDSRHLPASFQSTDNYVEAMAFHAKDAPLVVDEFNPPAAGLGRERMHRLAARLFRAQGNRAGRGRMRPDTSLRPPKLARSLPVATGEDLLRGQSLQARVWVLEIQEGDITTDKLSACQAEAAAGLYGQTTASFISWLAPR